MKGSVLRGLRAAGEILLPRQCITCGRRLLLEEKHLCLECLADLPQTYFWTMSHNPMADRFNENIQKDIKTDEDDGLHERYAYAAALFFYHSEAQYRLIPYQIKYHGNIRAGRYFGRMLGNRLASSELFEDVDMVVPVPLHWTRKWKRGYNQAEVIAEAVAEALGAPMRTDLLRRRKRTTTQTRMEVEDKRKNVAKAFVSTPSLADIAAQDGIRHLLLIDDVFTTGATLHACFAALRTVLPASVRISVATLGFVGGR
ncbi:MAG: ComF family protein [Bacteroidales bacterium]|nr:ComF family protein [Bacteroidales bacterium]